MSKVNLKNIEVFEYIVVCFDKEGINIIEIHSNNSITVIGNRIKDNECIKTFIGTKTIENFEF